MKRHRATATVIVAALASAGFASAQVTTAYRYDAQGRLIQSVQGAATTVYRYDKADNRTRVQAGNTAPVAGDQIVDQYERVAATLYPLANDSDPDGDPLTLQSVGPLEFVYGNNGTPTDLGTLTQTGNTVTYRAPAVCNCALRSKYHVIRFAYTVSDGKGGTATARHAINVYSQPPNTAPTANTGATSVWQATSNTVLPLANDTDPDGDPLTILSIDNFYFAYGRINGADLSGPPADIGSVAHAGSSITYRAPFLTSNGATGSSYVVVVVWYTASDSRGGTSQSYEVIAVYAPQ